ncbi:MAG: hypothetical protein KDA88_02440 [Planctomycetaceae bacterium]|nr:hypothetical protein [Planctomycetaceae bacterium]MCA9030379.1 hypothetical protein [Planctomycetaceae bacterium]MCB9952908.1 hypothetical protein [Planctomycetaceae bacterium]
MGDQVSKLPQCTLQDANQWVDGGTIMRRRSSLPLPTGERGHGQEMLRGPSSPVEATVEVLFPLAPGLTWDGFQRAIYDKAAQAIAEQAQQLQSQGRLTLAELEQFVSQRNTLKIAMRDQLSPFGKQFSELLQPRSDLKSMEQLLQKKGTVEAVVKGLGKTRGWVNYIGFAGRLAGPAVLVIQVKMSADVIAAADESNRWRVGIGEAAEITGGAVGGWYGFGVGCSAGAAATVWLFGAGAAGGCAVGGIAGALGIGFAAGKSLRFVAEETYDGGRAMFYWIENQ